MHVVIGGTFNGKNKWVRNKYTDIQSIKWLDQLENNRKVNLEEIKEKLLVFEGIEQWTKAWLEKYSLEEAREIGQEWIKKLLLWEKEKKERKIVLIATDISKGIVPIKKEDRDWRDLTGWFYQDLIKEADCVDEIWYGLVNSLK